MSLLLRRIGSAPAPDTTLTPTWWAIEEWEAEEGEVWLGLVYPEAAVVVEDQIASTVSSSDDEEELEATNLSPLVFDAALVVSEISGSEEEFTDDEQVLSQFLESTPVDLVLAEVRDEETESYEEADLVLSAIFDESVVVVDDLIASIVAGTDELEEDENLWLAQPIEGEVTPELPQGDGGYRYTFPREEKRVAPPDEEEELALIVRAFLQIRK